MYNGTLVKDKDGVWMVKWSDMHSFLHGTHWSYDYLSDDSNSIKVIEDNRVVYKPLKEDTEVQFEMVISGHDFTNQKAKLIFPEVEAFEKEELIKIYVTNNGSLFRITNIDMIRDGGTMLIQTSSTYDDMNKFYIHKDNWTLHNSYPPTEDNVVTDEPTKHYLLSRIERYKEHYQHKLNQFNSIIKNIKL